MREAWRYHAEYEPKIFKGEEIEIAEKAGWVDSPAKVTVLSADDLKFNKLIVKIDEVTDDEVSFIANHIKVEPAESREDTIKAVKEFLGLEVKAPRQDTDEEIALGFQIPENLIDLSVKKLKKLCKHRELTGYSNLNEAGLLALLEG